MSGTIPASTFFNQACQARANTHELTHPSLTRVFRPQAKA
jgi:hypothetical protein